MLYEIFPKHIADSLQAGKKVEPESHELVTIVFSDIFGFTDLSRRMSPLKVSKMLDRLYLAFDMISRKHSVFKVETIGGVRRKRSHHVSKLLTFLLSIGIQGCDEPGGHSGSQPCQACRRVCY